MHTLPSIRFTLTLIGVCAFFLSGQARAVGFDCISNNSPGQCTIGEAQLSVTLSSPGATQVRFDFANVGGAASSIAGIYFDDAALLASIASIVNGAGTSFAADGSPPVLPAANNADPDFESDFRVNANNPAPTNGVNPGETLGVIFNLAMGISVADVQAAFADGSLRTGLHVIAFTAGGSESFVNLPVPEPSVATLLGVGLAALSIARNRRPR